MAFVIRYLAIKDLGTPKRLQFGLVLMLKLGLTLVVVLVRLLQIVSSFRDGGFWLNERPYLSLLYGQFIAAQGLSFYLLVLQHLKRLPEVCYCQNLFWGLSFLASVLFIKFGADPLSLVYDLSLALTHGLLFALGLLKRATVADFAQSQRPLIREAAEWGSSATYSEMADLKRGRPKAIDFKFRAKLTSYQGSLLFEFRVFLPCAVQAEDLAQAEGVKFLGSGQYSVKKSLNDFFALSSHVTGKFGREAPKLDPQIFKHRLRGD